MTGLGLLKFMIANMLGKIVLSWIVAYAGRLYFDVAGLLLGKEGSFEAVAVAIVAMLIITVLLLKVDWEKVVEASRTRGVLGAIKEMFNSMFFGK